MLCITPLAKQPSGSELQADFMAVIRVMWIYNFHLSRGVLKKSSTHILQMSSTLIP